MLRLGYCLPFLSTPSSSPISITGAALEEVTLGLIAKGALELAPLPSPGFYSHLFVVWKTSGSWRPVIDLSHLIRFVDVSHFQMETIQSVLLSVRQGDWLASIDLKEAHLQVPVHPASRHFLRFMFRGTVYRFKALCFGLSTAPQVFTRVMAPVSAILHSLGIRMRRYLDVWLVQSSSRESLHEDLQTVLQFCQELGIVIYPQKSNLIPSQVVQYLGVVIDSTSFRASPSVERISRLRSTAAEFQSCASPTVSLWLSLLGVLSSLAHLVPGGRLRLWSLQLCLHRSSNRQDLEAPVLVSMECLHDLQWWLHLPRLSLGVSLRQVSPDLHFGPTPRTWDGVPISVVRPLPACGPPNRQRYLSTPGNCSLFSWGFSSSGQLSKVARWLSFVTTPQQWLTFARRVAPGLLSSTPWLRRSCAGRSPSLYARLHSSFRAPTRPVSPSPAPTYRVVSKHARLSIFEKTLASPNSFICHLRHHRCSIFFSHFRDPMSACTDAFLQSWEGLQAYAFPPVAIIPRVLATLWASTGTELTLVAPHWAQCPWFSDLLLQWSSRPVMTSCTCLGLVIFPRMSVGSGFMPSASPAIFQSLWLLIRSRGAVFAGAPSILARGISGAMVHFS